MLTVIAVLVAALLEAIVGEPPNKFHPVAWFGSAVALVDQSWRRPIVVGTLAAITLPLGAAVTVGIVVFAASSLVPILGSLAAGLALFLTTSLTMLLSSARSVIVDSDRDVDTARGNLLALAGRDASELSPALLRSAAVESAAENLADGLVASLGAFVLAGTVASIAGLPLLPVAAGAAAWIKAVNTMDSMLGYRSKRVGTPAARLDDAVMWVPARVSAVLLAVAAADPTSLVRANQWLDRVPSPNSGWPMGAAAGTLDVRLEKPGVYVLNASASLPTVTVAQRGIRQVALAGVLAYALATVLAYGAEVIAWF